MSNADTIRILQEFADHQRETIDDLGETVDEIKRISDNMSVITASISALLWKMEVLTHPILLKDIYDLTHDEWMNLTTEQVVEMVEAL